MQTCPKCKKGQMIIKVQDFTCGKKFKENDCLDMQIDCIHCDGTGEVSDEKLASIKETDRFIAEEMCSCDNPTFGSYPQDGECSCGMYKHHVHCGNCGKISQIG